MSIKLAVILAGGLGMRLRPLTNIIPKPLLPIGESTVLEIQILALRKFGVEKVIIAANYMSDYLATFIGSGERYGVRIVVSQEKEPLGTCGPLKLAAEHLTEPFFVMNGDILTDIDFGKLAEFALAKPAWLTVVTKEIAIPFRFGGVIADGDFITEIEEKPNYLQEILAGIYAMRPQILQLIPNDNYFGIDNLIKGMLANRQPVCKYLMHDYWIDIGQLSDYELAKQDYEVRARQPKTKLMAKALVLGGAGFIGSNICHRLSAKGFRVTAVDGLLPRTSGNRANLPSEPSSVELIEQRVEDVRAFPALVRGCDLVVDAMGWTSHWEAFEDPEYDLALNVASHLAVIRALPAALPRKLVYLGSTHQYGRALQGPIAETQPLAPVDVQGVHKAAAEHHYRIAAERHGFPVISLRFGNTFGPAQPLTGRDIGLVGDMIRRALAGDTITVYGEGRYRTLHYAPDLASIVERLVDLNVSGFMSMNVPGHRVAISELATQIAERAGGCVVHEALPAAVAAIDIGNFPLDCSLFEKHLGEHSPTPLDEAITASLRDARSRSG